MPHDVSLHSSGAYRYLPAIEPYSAGVAAEPGYEIVGLRFDRPPPVAEGFARLDRELDARGLPANALAGIELRSPEPFTFGGFDEFNQTYRALLERRGLLEAGVNPVARTNVVPVGAAPSEPALLAAFAVRPATGADGGRAGGGADFVVAGAGEVDGALEPASIVAFGDLSGAGLARKASWVLGEMRARLAALGHGPDAPNLVNVYTAHDVPRLAATVAGELPAVHRCGFVHWLTRPPVVDVEFEMDARRVSEWQTLWGEATWGEATTAGGDR